MADLGSETIRTLDDLERFEAEMPLEQRLDRQLNYKGTQMMIK